MFFVYIIYSASKDKYYIGQTNNVQKRLSQHILRKNLGANDWELKYKASYNTRSEAVQSEKDIKNRKRRSFIEELIRSSL